VGDGTHKQRLAHHPHPLNEQRRACRLRRLVGLNLGRRHEQPRRRDERCADAVVCVGGEVSERAPIRQQPLTLTDRFDGYVGIGAWEEVRLATRLVDMRVGAEER
jgi:hypothetical protein